MLRQIEKQECDYSKMENLSTRLKEALDEKGWIKADLKRASGIRSASTLTELCNGSRTESPQLAIIADALGVDVMWLQYGRLPKRRTDTPTLIATPEPTDPTLAYLDALPPAIAARLRLDIKHAHERWMLEQETSAHTHHRADDPPEKLPKVQHSG